MEQGDHVVKAPWSSWQYGINYFNNNWNGTYKGRGDKKAKYPYEGVYTRSNDVFVRNTSPLSNQYKKLPSMGLAQTSYGLISNTREQEPLVSAKAEVAIIPRTVLKNPLNVVTPTMTEPNPTTPNIAIKPPKSIKIVEPTAPNVNPNLPEPNASPFVDYCFTGCGNSNSWVAADSRRSGGGATYYAGVDSSGNFNDLARPAQVIYINNSHNVNGHGFSFSNDATGVTMYLAGSSNGTRNVGNGGHVAGQIGIHSVADGKLANITANLYGRAAFHSIETWHAGHNLYDNVTVNLKGTDNTVFLIYPAAWESLILHTSVNGVNGTHNKRGEFNGSVDVTIPESASQNIIYNVLGAQASFAVESRGNYILEGQGNMVYSGYGYSPNYKNLDGLFLKLDYQTSINDETVIYLYRTGNSCGSDTYYKTSWGYIKDKKGTVSFTVTPITFVNTVTCTNANPTVSPCDNFRVIKTSDLAEIEQYRKDLKEYLANAIKKIATSRKKEVVAVGQYNHIVNNFVTNVPEKQLYELEEKLHLLSYYTKIDVVLTFLPLRKNSYIPEHILSDLAQKAIEGVSGNKSDRKLVYLVVASSEYESIFKEGTIKKLNCYTISFAQTDNSIIRSKYKGNSIFEKLLTLYQDIPKPLIMNKYYQYADGSVRNYTYKSKENLRGYPFIKSLTFYQSKEFRRNKSLLLDFDLDPQLWKIKNETRLKESLKAEYAQDGLKNKALWEEVDIHQLGRFREVYMDYGIDKTPNYPLYLWQNSVDTWQFKNKVKIALEKGTLPPEVFYDFEKLKVLDDAVYGTLDVISLIPGADIFTDPLCAAYASARNDATNLTIYSAGAILPIASGAYIRGGAKALNEEIMVVVAKKADNDEVELVYKNINDIAPNELYIATAIDNKQTQAFLDETKKQLDLHSINTQLDNLGKTGKQIANLAEDLSKKTNNILTKAFSEGSKFIDDKKTIEKITHYLAPENAEKLKAIGGEQGLIDFLKKYKDAPCGNCKDAGRKIFGGRTLDEMLENYVEVAHTFRNRPDLWKKIEEGALSSNAAMREGTQHMLSTFKKNPKKYTPENIEHIDMKFGKALDDICPNCRYDVKFNNKQNPNLPLFEEFKSYNSETWSKIANDKGFIQQFKSYLQKVNKIEDLAYVINSNKANINEVKQAFKEVFKKEADNLFRFPEEGGLGLEKIRKLFGKDIDNASDFLEKVEDLNNPIYNFIKTN